MTTTTHEQSRPTWVGPDGTPIVVDDSSQTADRMARLADELAAIADHARASLALQDDALGEVPSATPGGQRRLNEARNLARKAGRSLGLISDRLGEIHTTCDELAARLAVPEGVSTDDHH